MMAGKDYQRLMRCRFTTASGQRNSRINAEKTGLNMNFGLSNKWH